MHNQILKFPLQQRSGEYGRTTMLPAGKILLIGEKDGLLHAWVEKNHHMDHVQGVTVYATGESVPDNVEHIGSAVVGYYVWHVYRR